MLISSSVDSYYHHKPSPDETNFDTSSGTASTASTNTSTIATNSTSSSPLDLLVNSSNSSIVSVELPQGGEFVDTNVVESYAKAPSNFSGSSTTRQNDAKKQEKSCDSSESNIFEGEWVRDVNRKPYYPPGSCPFVEQTFGCFQNGRPDDQFLQWQWQWQSKQTNGRCNDIP
ncbi:hypothetical protein MKW94_013513, partial [Papaver nudicaule]|nr:hypothetical protein [Papaver nudicaule]